MDGRISRSRTDDRKGSSIDQRSGTDEGYLHVLSIGGSPFYFHMRDLDLGSLTRDLNAGRS